MRLSITNLNRLCFTIIKLITNIILFFFLSHGNILLILTTKFQLIIRLLANTIHLKNIILLITISETILITYCIRLLISGIFINLFAFLYCFIFFLFLLVMKQTFSINGYLINLYTRLR